MDAEPAEKDERKGSSPLASPRQLQPTLQRQPGAALHTPRSSCPSAIPHACQYCLHRESNRGAGNFPSVPSRISCHLPVFSHAQQNTRSSRQGAPGWKTVTLPVTSMMSVKNFLVPSLQSVNRERMLGEQESILVRGRGPRLEQGPQSHTFRVNTENVTAGPSPEVVRSPVLL